MTPRLNKIFTLIILILILACGRVKQKTEQIADTVKERTKTQIKKQSQRIIDKVFPPFDYDMPDTENNKKRFRDFLKIDLTPDIKNLYCFDDAVGIDADYMFSFNCDLSTSNKIIKVNGLTLDTINLDNGFGLQSDFKWWDKKRIKQLQKYSWTNGEQYFKYYWYDSENRKAYFFDFDM